MRYSHILAHMATTPWAIEPQFMRAAMALVMSRAFDDDGAALDTDARLTQKRTEEARRNGAIAVLPLYGVMTQRMSGMEEACSGGLSVEKAMAAFKALRDEDSISAIVLDWDSPGGSTYGTEEFANLVYEARGTKPIISQVNSLMASAAFWVGSSADEVVVTPGGRAGSIGAFSVHEDISKALEMKGVSPTMVKGGRYKASTNPFGPLTEEGREQLEMIVKDSTEAFREGVAKNYQVSRRRVIDAMGDGLVYGAKQLVERGMAHRIGTLDDTLARLGVPSKKKAAAAQARATFANGEVPAIGVLTDALGSLGLSKSQAERFAAQGLDGLASGSRKPAAETQTPSPVRLVSRFIPTA